MDNYNFNEELYPSDITYNHPHYIFIFFTRKEQTNSFMDYLVYCIEENYKRYLNGDDSCLDVLRNYNDKYPMIDINYNFFIKVLGRWIEHYCSKKSSVVSYRKFIKVEAKNEEKTILNKHRDYEIELSTSEQVMLDFSYSDWLIGSPRKKRNRFILVQVLFNNVLGKFAYVANYKYPNKARPVTIYLVKNLKDNTKIKLVTLSLLRETLAKTVGKKQMKTLHKISEEFEILATGSTAVTKYIKKHEIDNESLKFCSNFDILEIEKNRDKGSGKYVLFDKKKGVEIEDE